MSGIRHNSRPWLADHVVFFVYRWLAWFIASLPLFWQELPSFYAWAMLGTGVLNIPATFSSQRYLRIARRTPAVMGLDIFYLVLVLHLLRLSAGPAEQSQLFALYSFSSLVLPALLFGWRGGVMAGLAYVTMDRAALWSVDLPAANMTARAWAELALTMSAPPAFGALFALLVDLLHWLASRGAQRRPRQTSSAAVGMRRDLRPDTVGFTALELDAERSAQKEPLQAPLALQATRVRAVEPGVEDLRRTLFAPLPAPDMELSESLDVLATRFGQHTGAFTRLVKLGRVRRMHPANRSVLVRLMQEALLNVQQHAHASSTVCTLRYDTSSVVLLLQDDGVGLLDGTYERPGLHALRAMQYRLAELGGRLDVFETEGGGVTVRATMPLE